MKTGTLIAVIAGVAVAGFVGYKALSKKNTDTPVVPNSNNTQGSGSGQNLLNCPSTHVKVKQTDGTYKCVAKRVVPGAGVTVVANNNNNSMSGISI